MHDKEVFVPVKDYEGLYEVSNFGRLKTLKRQGTDERFISGYVDRTGYLRVSLTKNSVSKSFAVHRLVCAAFINNPFNKRTVNHKDGNKLNNHIDNLEWMTHSENHKHSYDFLGRQTHMKGKSGALHHNAKKVKKTCLRTGKEEVFNTLKEASLSGDFCMGHISACCNNKRKTHKGYTWEFI